jgi:hypothetical protein
MAANLVRHPSQFILSVKPESGGGRLLLRHVTPLTRRHMIYFCFGAYITSVNSQVDFYPEVFGKFMSKTRTIQAMNQNGFQW